MENAPAVVIAGQILTTLVVIIKMIIDYRKEIRDRQWKLEDEAHKIRALLNQADIKKELTLNTQLSKEANEAAVGAFNEANCVNKKIADIGAVRRTNISGSIPSRRSEDTA